MRRTPAAGFCKTCYVLQWGTVKPPISFSPYWRKRNGPLGGPKKKRGWVQKGQNRASIPRCPAWSSASSRVGTRRTPRSTPNRCASPVQNRYVVQSALEVLLCAPGENPSEGAAAPFLVAGVRVSKGRGESKRLALWQVFAYFLSVQKVGAGPGCISPEENGFVLQPKKFSPMGQYLWKIFTLLG